MAQRKTPPSGQSSGNRPGGSRSTAAGGKVSTSKPNPAKPPVGRPVVRKPPTPPRKGKSIVNQKQTPWGMIGATIAVVLFAVAVVVVVIVTHKSDSSSKTYLSELPAAKQIKGLTFQKEPHRTHKYGVVKYDATPPVGGNHNPVWADCTGTVYKAAIANENAVHMLEHGAIWITYNAKTLPAAQLGELQRYVTGVNGMALSPFPNLKTPISLQAWGYQLFVQNASDPRIAKFISLFKYNPKTTPEYGATCSDPDFIKTPSTFGHPIPTGA